LPINTGSILFRSDVIQIVKNHEISLNLYGFHEYNYYAKEYTLMGVAWDFNYFARIGKLVNFRFTHNFGSPEVPGPQMGLNSFTIENRFRLKNKKRFIALQFINASRKYFNYDIEGNKMPQIRLFDQYGGVFYNAMDNVGHSWSAGPSIEFYSSQTPSRDVEGLYIDFQSQKVRLEYKSVIARRLTLDMKTGISRILYRELEKIEETRYDFHLMGVYSFNRGFSFMFNYDYGPMVNSGLYQYPGDALNHSFHLGPQVMSYFFNKRVAFNLFTALSYRFDLEYGFVTINPKIEAFLFKDWYAVASGTYTYSEQQYTEIMVRNNHYYFEFAIKKRWGKSDYNKWQKATRRLKIVYFKDENANGIKDGPEEGVPHVKTRLKLEATADQSIKTEFPVDITLLSNDEGIVIFNRLPMGFYDLNITPLGDIREYFYVDRGMQQLELIKTSTIYVPFQKAERIDGIVKVQRQKFIKEEDKGINLTSIKVTAYNNEGNSYSSFTRPDGRFVIYVPGDATYAVRMNNVFGNDFTINRNDIKVTVPDTSGSLIVFNVVERSRQINFKKPKPVASEGQGPTPLKLKVLHGKVYENRAEEGISKEAIPQFDMDIRPPEETQMETGYFYVVLAITTDREEAMRYSMIFKESGVTSFVGYDPEDKKYYVCTNKYNTIGDAREDQRRLKDRGYKKEVEIIKY